ncbi:MAG: hypothetical protein GEV13_33530 [Rhodospirillales bacterium]|nr:hypothetical protein [Rhodospirillales bacterium]
MPEFDFVLQMRQAYLQNIIAELRATARPLIAATFDEIPAFQVAGIEVHPVVNVEDGEVTLGFLPDDNAIELLLEQAEVQLTVRDEMDGADSLHEMRVDVRITLAMEGRSTDETASVGFDAAAVSPANVTASITTPHPLSDDDTLIDLMNRLIHQDYVSSDIPVSVNVPVMPIPGFPASVEAFIRVMNEDGGDPTRTIRVVNAPGADRFRLIVPLEVWANLMPDADPDDLQHVQFTADMQVDFDVERQLETSPAFAEAHLSSGDPDLVNIEPVEGEGILDNPIWLGALTAFAREQGLGILGDIEDPHVDAYTLAEIETLLANLVSDYFQSDGRFIAFWEAARNSNLLDVTPRVLDSVLAIGINAREDADVTQIEDFIPANRDFAVEIAPDFFLENVETFLHSPADYDDIEGSLRLDGEHAAEATTISVDGFGPETGTVRAETQLSIDGSSYRVTADAEIADNAAQLSISPGLFRDAPDNRSVKFVAGFGLPRTFDAGGNDRTVRLNDLNPTLRDGRLRLSGPFRLRRPHAIIRNIDGTVGLDLGMAWTGVARVRGGGQTGGALEIQDYDLPIRRITQNSIVIVDGIDQTFLVSEDVDVEGSNVTLSLSRDLPASPDNGAMVLLKWLAIGRVNGAEQSGETLQVDGLSLGEDLIPEGVSVSVGGEGFRLTSNATIEDGGATLHLSSALGDIASDGASVRILSGWWGHAEVDGDDQTGTTLVIRDVVRTMPGGGVLSVDGINGVFTVDESADITDDAAAVELDHSVVETLGELAGADTGEIWNLIGQPTDNAVVRMRVSQQEVAPRVLGDPDVELEHLIEGILGLLVGFFVALLTGNTFMAVVVAAIVALITRAIIQAVGGKKVSEEIDTNLVDAPLPEALSSLDLEVDSHFNNPIERRRFCVWRAPPFPPPATRKWRKRAPGPTVLISSRPV